MLWNIRPCPYLWWNFFYYPCDQERRKHRNNLYAFFINVSGRFDAPCAFQNILRFGENSIRSISAIIALSVSGLLLLWLVPFVKNVAFELTSKPHYVVLFFIPLIIAFIVYSILSKKLIQITQDQQIDTQQSAPVDDGNAAAPEP